MLVVVRNGGVHSQYLLWSTLRYHLLTVRRRVPRRRTSVLRLAREVLWILCECVLLTSSERYGEHCQDA